VKDEGKEEGQDGGKYVLEEDERGLGEGLRGLDRGGGVKDAIEGALDEEQRVGSWDAGGDPRDR
jgi:hypothetical protein